MRYIDTAAGQAAVLFVSGGALGLLGEAMPGATQSDGSRVVNCLALALGMLITRLAWERWDQRATIALVPAAFALIVAGQWNDPVRVGTLYALWFVVVFAWVGSWHPARTSLYLAPFAAAVYVIPFLPGSPAESPEAVATVAIAIPIAVVMAEVLAAKTAVMRRTQRALEASHELLERANLTDDLTGVGNRRLANVLLDSMEPGDGLILLDLDHFKSVNDTRGHAEGDRVLMQLGSFLLNAVRDADTVARYGGEEFIVLVRDAGAGLGPIAERLLAGWRDVGTGVTVSAGAAIHTKLHGPTVTLKRADELLYQAKAAGRDQIALELAPTPAAAD